MQTLELAIVLEYLQRRQDFWSSFNENDYKSVDQVSVFIPFCVAESLHDTGLIDKLLELFVLSQLFLQLPDAMEATILDTFLVFELVRNDLF